MFKGKSKAFKITIFSLIAVLVLAVGGILALDFLNGASGQGTSEPLTYKTATVKEEKLTSATLLTGSVKATEEQYVYYDPSKGDLSSVAVNVGDQVQVGQVLATYNAVEAQQSYDSAVRALNKVDRQIYELRTYGTVVTTTGDEATDQETTANAQRTVDRQLQDLYDARADAADAVNKAQAAVDSANVKSTVAGTVVEVNRSVSRGNTNTSQTIVHVVNSGSLVVAGEMSEYNLANIRVDQDVKMTSKVYPDKTWTGKVSYISDYPADADVAATASNGSGSGTSSAKYPFKVTLTSELGDLKQGFTVNIQVDTNQTGLTVPVEAVLSDDGTNHYVYTYNADKKTIKRVDVKIGNADGANQQITSGLNKGDTVLADPTMELQDGQEVTVDEKATN